MRNSVILAPMAIAMMGGLVAATILTLTFLPALYALAFKAPRRIGERTSDRPGAEDDSRHALPAAALA